MKSSKMKAAALAKKKGMKHPDKESKKENAMEKKQGMSEASEEKMCPDCGKKMGNCSC